MYMLVFLMLYKSEYYQPLLCKNSLFQPLLAIDIVILVVVIKLVVVVISSGRALKSCLHEMISCFIHALLTFTM